MKLELEIEPVGYLNRNSESDLLLVCEHAGCAIPSILNNLGLSENVIQKHIAWDVGAFGLAKGLAGLLDAELIFQNISRLVVDCNRPQGSVELIPETSEGTYIPGNDALSDKQRSQRIERIWMPFQDAIAASLNQRQSSGRPSVLIAIHSFNPVYHGVSRPWHVCLAYNKDQRLAKLLYKDLKETSREFVISLNKPFFVTDDDDQTIPAFGEARAIPHVLIEIRNDLLNTQTQQLEWASRVGKSIRNCIKQLVL